MDVRLPDGTVVKGVPDGISKSDLATKLKSNGMNVPEEWLKPSTSVTREELTGFNKALAPKPTGYQGVGKEAVGAGEAALTAASGVAAPFTGLAKSGGQLLTGNKPDVYQNIQSSIYQPRTAAGQRDVRAMGDVLNSEALRPLQGINPMQAAELGAASQGLSRAPQVQAATQAVPKIAGKASEAVSGAVGALGTKLTPELSPELVDLGRKAQALGIPVRPDMLTNNKYARMVGDFLEKPFLSGGKSEQRQTAFNQAVIESIGGDSNKPRLTSDVFNKAITQSGEKIGGISSKYRIPANTGLDQKLNQIVSNMEFETSDVGRIVNKYVKEIKSKVVDMDQAIDGEAFRKIRTQLVGQMRRTRDGDLRSALSNVDEAMLDSIQSVLSPEELSEFNKARVQYANAKTIEPIIAKGTGDISPSALMGRMTATGQGKARMAKGTGGDLGDIARIGQMFLTEPTSNKQAIGIGAGEVGALLAAPYATGAALGGANLYNRVIAPSLTKRILGTPQP